MTKCHEGQSQFQEVAEYMGELAEDYIRDTSGREPSSLLAMLLSQAIVDILEKRETLAAALYDEMVALIADAPDLQALLVAHAPTIEPSSKEWRERWKTGMPPYDQLPDDVKDRMRALADQLSAKAVEMAGEEEAG